MIQIYSDGSCPRNPGPGGWAFCIIVSGALISRKSGGEAQTTNNRMEMMAAFYGLRWIAKRTYLLNRTSEIKLLSDSQYVILGLSEWAHRWRAQDWKRKNKKGKLVDIENKDLWPKLYKLAHTTLGGMRFEWVRGHAGNEYNEMCDKMAGQAAWSAIEKQ